MPLAFHSLSHGTIAFGFFNIEIDMLVLEHLFFFADRFCSATVELARASVSDPLAEVVLPGFAIRDPGRAGNVNAAISRVDLSGFIGATYMKFPFPTDRGGFKQKPYGQRNQPWAQECIVAFGERCDIALRWSAEPATISIDGVNFARDDFALLIDYVDRGGYPRWQDETRPGYVKEMIDELSHGGFPAIAPDCPG